MAEYFHKLFIMASFNDTLTVHFEKISKNSKYDEMNKNEKSFVFVFKRIGICASLPDF